MATLTKRDAQMAIEDFARTIEAAPLTPKMRKFVLDYVQGYIDTGKFDVVAAAKSAYTCKDDRSARCMGYQLLVNPKVILALNQFLGLSQKESFLRRLERAIYNEDITIAQVRALELTARANGWTSELPRHQALRVKPPKSGKASKVTPTDPLACGSDDALPSSIPIFPPAEPKYRVGTIANDPDDGKPYILLAVSADGNEVTEARLLTKNEDGTFLDSMAKGASPTYDHVPPGATPLVDKAGIVRGYRTAAKEYVQFAAVESL